MIRSFTKALSVCLATMVLGIFSISVYAQDCGESFTDSGGIDDVYSALENITFTFCADDPATQFAFVEFSSFNIESGWDFMDVFDGADNTGAVLAADLTGATIPGPFSSTNAEGCLTFNFTSDGSGQLDGWEASFRSLANGCVLPTATLESVCVDGDTDNYYVDVTVAFGGGVAYTISNSVNGDTWAAADGAVVQAGPFANGVSVDFFVADDAAADCFACVGPSFGYCAECSVGTYTISPPAGSMGSGTAADPYMVALDPANTIDVVSNADFVAFGPNPNLLWAIYTAAPTDADITADAGFTGVALSDGTGLIVGSGSGIFTNAGFAAGDYWIVPAITDDADNLTLDVGCLGVDPTIDYPVFRFFVPPTVGCSSDFTDTGGALDQYQNNEDEVFIFCPTDPSAEVSELTFSAFNLEDGFDFLTIYDGDDLDSPVLAADLTGTTVPGPFAATGISGCLTINFTSDGSAVRDGWEAIVGCAARLCAPPAVTAVTACDEADPDNFYVDVNITFGGSSSYTISAPGITDIVVTDDGVDTRVGPFANESTVSVTVADDEDDTGTCDFTASDLTAFCGTYCGYRFTDTGGEDGQYQNDEDETFTFCADDPANENIQVTFDSFNTEANFDFLSVYNGADITADPIEEDIDGTDIPGPFISSNDDGCLTFRFTSDGSAVRDGWAADVTCVTCITPTVTFEPACDDNDLSVFFINVGITFGSGTSYTITNDAGVAPVQVTEEGTVMYGPFPGDMTVEITVTDDIDGSCSTSQAGLAGACDPGTCPSNPVASSDVAVACNSDLVTFSVDLANAILDDAVPFFERDFNTGTLEDFTIETAAGPCSWTVTDNGGDNIDGSVMVLFDDDACGSGAAASESSLISPIIDLSSYSGALQLDFDYNFRSVAGGESFVVEAFDGVDWQVLFIETNNNCGEWGCEYPHGTFDLTNFNIGGNTQFQVRFVFKDPAATWGWYAGIDNFKVSEVVAGNYQVDWTLPNGQQISGQDLSASANVSTTNLFTTETVEAAYVVTCTLDGSEIANGTIPVEVSPPVTENVQFSVPEVIGCSAVVESLAPAGEPSDLMVMYSTSVDGPFVEGPVADPAEGEQITYFYTVSVGDAPAGSACQASGNFTLFCPAGCPTLNSADAENIEVCSETAVGFSVDVANGSIQAPITEPVPGTNVGGFEFTRPGAGTTCNISTTTTSAASFEFEVSADGDYDITISTDYDAYLHLYEGSFDPADQCTNYLNGDDDFNGTTGSQIAGESLTAGTTYIAVISSFGTATGNFAITVTGDSGFALAETELFSVEWAYGDQSSTSSSPSFDVVTDNTCTSEAQSASYVITCLLDDSIIAQGDVAFTVFPVIDESDLTLPPSSLDVDAGCLAEIANDCGLDIMYSMSAEGPFSSDIPAIADGMTMPVYYTASVPGATVDATPCSVFSSSIVVSCGGSLDCPNFGGATASSDEVCHNSEVTIDLLLNNAVTSDIITVAEARFDNGADGFTAENEGGGCDWQIGVTDAGSSIDGTNMALFDDDECGDTGTGNIARLVSPVYDLSTYSEMLMEFDYNFQWTAAFSVNTTFDVEVWDGAAWQMVLQETGANCGAWGCAYPNASIDVSDFLSATFQARFTYNDPAADWGWYAGVDNFKLGLPVETNYQIVWTDANGNEQAATESTSFTTNLLNLTCDAEVQTIGYTVQCLGFDEPDVSGSIDVTVYPELVFGNQFSHPDELVAADDTGVCAVEVVDECGGLTVAYSETGDEGTFTLANVPNVDAGSSATVFYQVSVPGAPADCEGATAIGSYSVACAALPTVCPTDNTNIAAIDVCSGGDVSVTLDVADAIPTGGEVVFEERFENGFPADWSSTVLSGTVDWVVNEDGLDNGTGNPGTGGWVYFLSSDDEIGNATELYSPVVDASSTGLLALEFDYNHQDFAGAGSLTVEVFDGTDWQVVFFVTEDEIGSFAGSVAQYANADFQIRFLYDDDNNGLDWGVGLDNVVLRSTGFANYSIDWTAPDGSVVSGEQLEGTFTASINNSCGIQSESINYTITCLVDGSSIDGSIDLNVYPAAPTDDNVASLVVITEFECESPTISLSPACDASLYSITQTSAVLDTILPGDVGAVEFELLYAGLPECCGAVVERVTDGSFEVAGIPDWNGFSLNFGTPSCTAASCGTGTGTGANTGDTWIWFGGIGTFEEASVSQDVLIPSSATALTFALEQIVCDSDQDYMEVLIDGDQVFLTTGGSALCGVLGYTEQVVDISDYADNMVHTIEFRSEIFAVNGAGTNFFVDDVSVSFEEVCSYTVSGNYDCPDCPIPSLGIFGAYEVFCGSGAIDLPADVVVDDDRLATFTWFDGFGDEVSSGVQTLTYDGDGCAPTFEIFQVYAGCDIDEEFNEFAGNYSVCIFPELPQNAFNLPNGNGCTLAIEDNFCGDLHIIYSLDGVNYSPEVPAAVPGQTVTVFYQVSQVFGTFSSAADPDCSASGTYQVFCESQCAAPFIAEGIDGDRCSDDLDISASVDFSGGDDAGLAFVWYLNGSETDETGSSYSGAVDAPAACGSASYGLSVMVTCTLDGGETMLDAGSITVYGDAEFSTPATGECAGIMLADGCDATVTYMVAGAEVAVEDIMDGDMVMYNVAVDGAPEGCSSVGSYECGGEDLGTFVSGNVFFDTNFDGIWQLGTEQGLGGIEVTLYDVDGNVIGITTTNAGGFYIFPNVDPGEYYVVFTVPDGFSVSPVLDENLADPSGQTPTFEVDDVPVTLINGGLTPIVEECDGVDIQVTATATCAAGEFDMYYIDVEITGGAPSENGAGTYTLDFAGITVDFDSATGSATASFGPIVNGTEVVFAVADDGNGCSSDPVSVTGDCTPTCGTSAGDMPDDTVFLCADGSTDLATSGEMLDDGDVLIYAIHTGSGSSAGTVFATNADGGVFSAGDVPSGGDTYFVSAIAGPDANDDGIPDLDDPCTQVAAGTPVVFFSGVNISNNEVTDCNAGTAMVIVIVNGGYGDFDQFSTYSIDITGFGTITAAAGEAFEVGPYNIGDMYEITATDNFGCTASTQGIPECTVPVELIEFTGEVMEEGNELKWLTASELNSDYFTLMHSMNGFDFNPIATVESAGTTSTVSAYDYLHKEAPAGLSYYQLIQTDLDGSQEASNVITLLRGESQFGITQVSPNPASNFVEVIFTSFTDKPMELEVYDASGRLVETVSYNANAGNNTYRFDVVSYPIGMYFVSINDGTTMIREKFIKE